MDTYKKVFTGILTGVLSFIFITAGVLKVTPKLSVEAHKHLYKDFVRYARIHPAVHFGYKIDPKKFMPQVGIIEIVAGVFLLAGPIIIRLLSCLIMSSVMVGALFFVYKSNKPNEEMLVPCIVLFLAFMRLNLFFSPTTKQRKKKKETKKPRKENRGVKIKHVTIKKMQ